MTAAEAIVVGAGQGRRMGAAVPKVYLSLAERPVLLYSVLTLLAMPEIGGIVLVVPAGEETRTRDLCRNLPGFEKVRSIITGGARRQDSVRAGLDQMSPRAEVVLIHDAARPFAAPELIRRVLAAAREVGAAVPGIPVADTLKQVGTDQRVARTLDRRNLVAVQTPQGFRREVLRQAYAHAWEKDLSATDDAGLVELAGLPVAVVPGDPMNFKLTTTLDFKVAEALQASRE